MPMVKLGIFRLVLLSGQSRCSGKHVSRTPGTCALCIHSPSTLANLVCNSFSLKKREQTRGWFRNCVGGVMQISENLVFGFFSSTLFRRAAMKFMKLQTFMPARCQSMPMVKLWIFRLVFLNGQSRCWGNHVSRTPSTCALCIQSPSTLASLGVQVFSLKKQEGTRG